MNVKEKTFATLSKAPELNKYNYNNEIIVIITILIAKQDSCLLQYWVKNLCSGNQISTSTTKAVQTTLLATVKICSIVSAKLWDQM